MADVVHILHLGGALCGKVGTPAQWESGHKWVALLNDAHGSRGEATCEGCLRSARARDPITGEMTAETAEAEIEFMARQLAARPLSAEEERAAALRTEGERRVAAVIREHAEPSPLEEVFREHGEALLRALFAWRGQGSITRWKTRPSRALAHLADRIGREYPGATGELQKAGVADAVDDVLSAAARRRTPKGFAAELSRLRDELGSLGLLVDELADYAHEVAEDEPRKVFREQVIERSLEQDIDAVQAVWANSYADDEQSAALDRILDRAERGEAPAPEAKGSSLPPPLPRTRELLRRFAKQWNEGEAQAATPEYVGGRFDLLREVLDAFAAEDRES